MGNLRTLTQKIKKYFELVDEHEARFQGWIKELIKPCNSIFNQSLLLRAVIHQNSTSIPGFENQPLYKEALISCILKSLDKEFDILQNIRIQIKEANAALCIEQKAIETLYCELRDKNLIDKFELNPCSPPLEHIVTWCSDIWRYYHSYYLQIHQGLLNLDYENEKSVSGLLNGLEENVESKSVVNKIRSFNLSHFEFLN